MRRTFLRGELRRMRGGRWWVSGFASEFDFEAGFGGRKMSG